MGRINRQKTFLQKSAPKGIERIDLKTSPIYNG